MLFGVLSACMDDLYSVFWDVLIICLVSFKSVLKMCLMYFHRVFMFWFFFFSSCYFAVLSCFVDGLFGVF